MEAALAEVPTPAIPEGATNLGACLCPGKPHELDWVRIKERLGYFDLVEVGGAGADDEDTGRKVRADMRRLFELGIDSWNLVTASGDPLSVADIDQIRGGLIGAELDKLVEASRLPNESGASSPITSLGRAERRRAAQTTRKSGKRS